MVEEFLNAFQSKYGAVSKKWKHWVVQLDLNTREECRKMHGMIYAVNEKIRKKPPRLCIAIVQLSGCEPLLLDMPRRTESREVIFGLKHMDVFLMSILQWTMQRIWAGFPIVAT